MSEAQDIRVDKRLSPVLAPGDKLKLAIFATNMRGGVTLADVEGKVLASWEESVRLAQHADRIGIDAVISVARWRGFGGKANLSDRSFEPFTWSTGLLALTKRIQVFATVQVPIVHPTLAAKMSVTADHVSGGRLGLNVVAGWYPEEFAMFGLEQQSHDMRYDIAEEWISLVKQLWTQPGEHDFNGRHYKAVAAFSEPKPLQQPYPVLMNAGTSPSGRAFAARHSDLIFAPLQTMAEAKRQIVEIKRFAHDSVGRDVRVFGRAHVVCRDREQDARNYWRHVHRDNADVDAIGNYTALSKANSQSLKFDEEERGRLIETMAAGRGSLPLVGTPAQIVEAMAELTDSGLDGLVLSWVNFDEGLDQMEHQILPLMVEAGLRVPSQGLATVG
jgi:dimethylsulfone monooxygenase